MAVLRLAA